MRLLVFPALAWCLLFSLRCLYHEQEGERLQAEEEALAADRSKALLFAQEPPAVLNIGYVCAIGRNDVAAQIVNRDSKLESCVPLSGGTSVRHTALNVEGFTQEGVLRRNRRNFRYPSFRPETSASRSMISLLL